MGKKQKPMTWFNFKIMTIIMNIRKKGRNIIEEISLAEIKNGDVILDYGCGPGFNTIPAAKLVGNEGKVYALDISPQAVTIVKNKVKKEGLENIKTILLDDNTGLKNNCIDITYLHNVLPLVKDKKGTLDEIYRILKTGGKLSYMSRKGSKIAGEDTMSDLEIKKYLLSDNKFQLENEKSGHYIYKKI